MPHGAPDWGLVGPRSTTYGLNDLGEAMVRLGSPHLWDRRGDVLFLTDFAEGIGPFQDESVATDHVIQLWTSASRQGAYAVRLIPGATNPFDCALLYELAPPVMSRIGFEFSFSLDIDTLWIEAEIQYRDGARYYHCALRYELATASIFYWDATPVWQPLATPVNLTPTVRPGHMMKLVVDMLTHEYVRCIVDDVDYSMAGFAVEDNAPSLLIAAGFYIRVTGVLASVGDIFVDNVIITHNEP